MRNRVSSPRKNSLGGAHTLCQGWGEFRQNKKHQPRSSYVFKTGTLHAPPGARTLDTLIKSQVLYQLS